MPRLYWKRGTRSHQNRPLYGKLNIGDFLSKAPHVVQDLVIAGLGCRSPPGLLAGVARSPRFVSRPERNWARCQSNTYLVDRIYWRAPVSPGPNQSRPDLAGPKFGCFSPVEQRVPSPTRGWRQAEPCPTDQSRPVSRAGRKCGKAPLTACAALYDKESRPVSRGGGRRQVRLANGRTPNASPRTGFRQTTALGIGQGIPRFCARRNNPENCRWRPRS